MCPVFVIAGKTPEERKGADGFVRAQIAFYGSTRTYRKIFETHGWEDVPAAVGELTHGGAHVSVDALGSAVTCANSVRSLRPRGRPRKEDESTPETET